MDENGNFNRGGSLIWETTIRSQKEPKIKVAWIYVYFHYDFQDPQTGNRKSKRIGREALEQCGVVVYRVQILKVKGIEKPQAKADYGKLEMEIKRPRCNGWLHR